MEEPPPMDDVVEESLEGDAAPAQRDDAAVETQNTDEDVPLHEPTASLAERAERVTLEPAQTSAPAPAPTPAAAAAAAAPSPAAPASTPATAVVVAAALPAALPVPTPIASAGPSAAAAAPLAAAAAVPMPRAPATASIEEAQMQITVTNPERIGDGMSSYMTYTVTTKTTLPSFREPQTVVKHRYSDFFNLYKHLEDQYPGVIVPVPPPKDAIGTGLSKFKSGAENSSFIERRTQALSRFMQRIAAHPVLYCDPVVRTFLETTDKIPKPSSTSVFASLSAKLGSFMETDEWFSQKANEVDTLESQLKKVHAVQEGLVNRRKDLSTAGMALVESLAALAGVDDQQTVSKAMHALSDVQARVAKLQLQQAVSEFFDFSEIIADYLSLIAAIKLCFGQRQTAYKVWQSAEATLVKKREAEAKLAAMNKQDKKEQAARDVLEAETNVQTAKRSMEDITDRLRGELNLFDKTKVKEFRSIVTKQVEALMTMEHQILKAWEQYLPEAKAIAS